MNARLNAPQELAGLTNPEVRCCGDAVVVDRMVVREPGIFDYYAAMRAERRPAAAHEAFSIGTRALAAAGGSATMAALDERLSDAVGNARQALSALPQAFGDRIEEIWQRYLGERGEFGARLEDDVLGPMREAISGDVRRRVVDALEPLAASLNVNDPNGPLGLVQRTLQELKSGQAALVQMVNASTQLRAQRETSVAKGYDLERFIETVLGELASRLGDRFENCSTVAGLMRECKEGDFVASLDPQLVHGGDVRVVVEAKNRKTESAASVSRVLKSARENRGAAVGIGVITNPSLSCAPITFSGPETILVHLPGFGAPEADAREQTTLLRLAYYVARMQAVALGVAAPGHALDSAVVYAHLDRLAAAVARFGALRRHLTGIESAVEKARGCADLLRDDIDAIAEELRETVARSAKPRPHRRSYSRTPSPR